MKTVKDVTHLQDSKSTQIHRPFPPPVFDHLQYANTEGEVKVTQYEYYAAVHDTGYPEPFVLLVGCEDSTTVTTKLYSFTLNRLETHLIYFLEVGFGTRIVSDS